MRRIFALTLAGGLLLFSGARTAAADPARFMAFFCPECWEYLWGPDAKDIQGNCRECGKFPVRLEAQRMSWWWCVGENRWRRIPCHQNPIRRCCTQEESIGASVGLGPGVLVRWYCPADRAFTVYRLPVLMQIVCGTCARPAVEVTAVERTWTWCKTGGGWATEPCPMNPVMKCCSDRKGLLLVDPDFGPNARRDIGEEGRTDSAQVPDSRWHSVTAQQAGDP